jgi:hypothetical protein
MLKVRLNALSSFFQLHHQQNTKKYGARQLHLYLRVLLESNPLITPTYFSKNFKILRGEKLDQLKGRKIG